MPTPPAPAEARAVACAPSYFPPAAYRVVLLGPQDCRWPIGEVNGEAFGFCSAPRLSRSCYCARHKALSCEAGS